MPHALLASQSPCSYVDVLDAFGWAPLHYAVQQGQAEAIAVLLSQDANIVARTFVVHLRHQELPAGMTPLHLAAAQGSLPLVKLLLRTYVSHSPWV